MTDGAHGNSLDNQDKESADPLLTAVGEMRAMIGQLVSQVSREHDRAQAREGVIDRLHEEVQRFRAGERREPLRPMVTDLRLLRDDLIGQSRSVPESMTRDQVATLLASYADSVALILERCGVVAVRPAVAGKFDPREQQASDLAKTNRADLDGMIASVVRDGYADADTGRPVAPARVIVYRFAAGPPDAPDQPDQVDHADQAHQHHEPDEQAG